MRITAERLSYTYNAGSLFATAALKDVSLTIEEGEFFGIIGHTGSGKSTFVQHLNGLLRVPSSLKRYREKKPKKGKPVPPKTVLTVGEFDLTSKKTDFRALRKKVGMVFQYPEYQLFAETVKEDVAFGLKNFSDKKLTAEEKEAAVRAALGIVGLNYEEIKDKSPFDLSGGQKRRVAIAGVIVTKPSVLILDEPAAGLDPSGKKDIMELLHKLHRERCKTVIIVSHDMDEVAENCTKTAVISNGEVVMCDSPAKLFSRTDELLKLGLDVPLTSRLCSLLKEKGIEIECDCTSADFARKVTEVYEGGQNA